MTSYKLNLVNKANAAWFMYVYQALQNPALGFLSPVWQCSPFMIAPNVNFTFEWATNYIFVWGNVGIIKPGVVFSPNEMLAADLQTANVTNFSASPEPRFSSPVKGSQPGTLAISIDGTVPGDTFSVGIGMGDSATFVMPAAPNQTVTITPPPALWIAADTNVQVGTIIDTSAVKRSFQVTFPPDIFEVTCTLDKNDLWSQASG